MNSRILSVSLSSSDIESQRISRRIITYIDVIDGVVSLDESETESTREFIADNEDDTYVNYYHDENFIPDVDDDEILDTSSVCNESEHEHSVGSSALTKSHRRIATTRFLCGTVSIISAAGELILLWPDLAQGD